MLYRAFSPCSQSIHRFFREKALGYLKENKRIFWIVPEQMSVSHEAQLASFFPPSSNFTLEVLNFSRLPNRVFRQLGGLSFRPVDQTGKLLMLFRALQSLEKDLKYLQIPSDRPATVGRLAAQIREFEDFGISPDQLEELSLQAKDAIGDDISFKLMDLAAISRRYRELMDANFDDTPSEYRRLLELLSRERFFADAIVIIEGFYDFTADQYALMRRIAVQAEDLYVGLYADGPQEQNDNDLYARTRKAAKKISLMAPADEQQDLFFPAEEERPRELLHLATEFSALRTPYPQPCPRLHLTRCRSAYDEVCHIASSIRRLVKNGMKYSQIAVAFRQDATYPQLCQSVFPRFDIPFHCSVVQQAAQSPLLRFAELACRIACGDRRLKTFRDYIKTELTLLSEEESFALENYAITWEISGKLWLNKGDWVMPPQGYGSEFSEDQKEELALVNHARRRLITPLLALRQALEGTAPLKDKLKGLVDFFAACQVEEQLARRDADLRRDGDFAAADAEATLWNTALKALEQLQLTAGEVPMKGSEFCDWLRLAFQSCEIGTLPPAPDCVLIGEASFMRSTEIAVLFVPGLNAKIFPSEEPPAGILTPAERKLFSQESLELSDSLHEENNDYFLFDRLIRTPNQELFFSYHEKKTASANPCAPSVFVSTLKEMFPYIKEENYDPEVSLPTCREEAFRYYCSHYQQKAPGMEFLDAYFADDPRTLPLKSVDAYRDSAQNFSHSPLGTEDNVYLSQSALEQYTLCRYRYFSRYQLKLKDRPNAYPDPTGEGNMVHTLLEKFFKKAYATGRSAEQWSETEIRDAATQLCREYFAAFPCQDAADQKRIDYLILRAAKSLYLVIKNLLDELADSDFVPFLFEAEIPKDLPAYPLPLPDGSRLILRGKIDRIDLYRGEDGTEYARVIDYKSSSRELSLQDVYNGLNLQMLIYLFSLWKNGIPKAPKDLSQLREVLPAGILYVTVTAHPFSLDQEQDKDPQNELSKKLRRHGLILHNEEVRTAMEKSQRGIFISKRNPEKYLATLEQFSLLQQHTEAILLQTAIQLKKGLIAPDPFATGKDSCKNCSFHPVCKWESRPTKRYEYFDNKDDVLHALEEEYR